MTIITSCGRQRVLARFIGLAIAACAMTSILIGNPLVIPASQQGQGGIAIFTSVADPDECNSGLGAAPIGPTCTLSATSPVGQADGGTMMGTGTAYTDADGLHASVDLSASGNDEFSHAEAEAGFEDTITNTSFFTASFQIGFHVNATLTGNAGAYSRLNILFSSIAANLQTWSYAFNGGIPTTIETVDSDYLTPSVTLAPGASYTYILDLDAYTQTVNELGATSPDAPDGSVNALNTLTITSFAAQDSFGNPLPASDFSSSDGANYSSLDTPSTVSAPEPGTFVLCGAFLVLLGVRRRRRPPSSR